MSAANFQGRGAQSRGFAHAATLSDPVVFASDHGKAKQYWVVDGGFGAVFDHVFGLPKAARTFYEIIPPDTPCKLYFDLDLAGDESVIARMDAAQEKLVVAVNQALLSTFDVVADPLILTSDGTKPDGTTKASRHLVWSVYFADFTHVKAFVEQLLPFDAVDGGVYTKNRCMRFCGCHKVGDDRVLRAVGAVAARRAVFMRSLITAPPPPGTTLLRMTLAATLKRPRAPPGAPRAPKRAATSSVFPKLQAVADRFRAAFDGIPPGAETREIRAREFNRHPQACWRWDGGQCELAGRVHKSNGTMFKLDLITFDGYFTCLDGDCDGVWGRGNYARVLDPDAFRYRANRALPRRWFRALERFIDTVVAVQHPEANVRNVKFDVLQQHISIECDIQPNPCACADHHHQAFHTTLAVIHLDRRGAHIGFWECRGYGSGKQRRELCNDVSEALAECGFRCERGAGCGCC